MSKTTPVCLWSGPRNVSTALMYSFAQRKDTSIVDEPLYAHYLNATGAVHPGGEEVLAAQNQDGNQVIKDVIYREYETPYVFIKHMAHHLVKLDMSFLPDCKHIILTRDPVQMLPSLINQIPQPALRDTGLARQWNLVGELMEIGQHSAVLDARELLLHPESILRKLCAYLEMEFDSSMLAWPAGPRAEDGVWAKYWYQNVHKSTGFQAYKKKDAPFPEFLKPLLDECLPYYKNLYELALKA